MLSKLFFKTARAKKINKPSDKKAYPKEWVTIHKKTYPRFENFLLTKEILSVGDLRVALEKRFSSRDFTKAGMVSESELSTLLYYSAGVNAPIGIYSESTQDEINKTRRFYPSGGARYPLEVYVVINRVLHIDPGVYHYDIFKHSLEKLFEKDTSSYFNEKVLRYEWSKDASVIFIISACWDRTLVKYDDFGYDMFGVEAGHVTQNLLLSCSMLDIKSCPLFGFNVAEANELLDLDAERESVFYMTALGR